MGQDLPIAKSPIEQRERKNEFTNELPKSLKSLESLEINGIAISAQSLEENNDRDSEETIFDLNGKQIAPRIEIFSSSTSGTWPAPASSPTTTSATPKAITSTQPVTTSTSTQPVITSGAPAPPDVNKSIATTKFQRFAVISSNAQCSNVGRKLLKRGVNAMEASIGMAFCLGALEPHQGGIGGGLTSLLFDRRTNSVFSIDGLVVSPQAVTDSTFTRDPMKRFIGYPSLGVPGALHALWQTFRRFPSGRISWIELILPTIEILQNGFRPSETFLQTLRLKRSEIETNEILRKQYLSAIEAKTSQNLTDFQLADTLRRIATSRDPCQLFYRGDIANQIVREVKTNGGHLQKGDLVNYESILSTVTPKVVNENTHLFGLRPPSSSFLIQLVIGLIEENLAHLKSNSSNQTVPISREHFFAALLHAESQILPLIEEIADPRFSRSDDWKNYFSKSQKFADSLRSHLETHRNSENNFLGVIDENGNAVALSMSLGSSFGSLRRSETLGILWNDGLSRFSTSAESPNSIEPRKRARSLASPLLVRKGNEELTILFSPLLSIQSVASTAQIVAEILFLKISVEEAMGSRRIWSQSPRVAEFEIDLAFPMVQSISKTTRMEMQPVRGLPAVHGITRIWTRHHQGVAPFCDHRDKYCFLDGF